MASQCGLVVVVDDVKSPLAAWPTAHDTTQLHLLNCPICQEDICSMSSNDQSKHINGCLDIGGFTPAKPVCATGMLETAHSTLVDLEEPEIISDDSIIAVEAPAKPAQPTRKKVPLQVQQTNLVQTLLKPVKEKIIPDASLERVNKPESKRKRKGKQTAASDEIPVPAPKKITKAPKVALTDDELIVKKRLQIGEIDDHIKALHAQIRASEKEKEKVFKDIKKLVRKRNRNEMEYCLSVNNEEVPLLSPVVAWDIVRGVLFPSLYPAGEKFMCSDSTMPISNALPATAEDAMQMQAKEGSGGEAEAVQAQVQVKAVLSDEQVSVRLAVLERCYQKIPLWTLSQQHSYTPKPKATPLLIAEKEGHQQLEMPIPPDTPPDTSPCKDDVPLVDTVTHPSQSIDLDLMTVMFESVARYSGMSISDVSLPESVS